MAQFRREILLMRALARSEPGMKALGGSTRSVFQWAKEKAGPEVDISREMLRESPAVRRRQISVCR